MSLDEVLQYMLKQRRVASVLPAASLRAVPPRLQPPPAPTNVERRPRHNLVTAILRRVTSYTERQVAHATNRITCKTALHTITPVPSAAYLTTMRVYVASSAEATASHTQGAGVTRWRHCCLWCPVFRQQCFTTHGHKRNNTRPSHLQSVLWCMRGGAKIRPPTHRWRLAQSNPRGRPRTWPLYTPLRSATSSATYPGLISANFTVRVRIRDRVRVRVMLGVWVRVKVRAG